MIWVYFLPALIKAMTNMPSSQNQFVDDFEDKVILKEFVILVVKLWKLNFRFISGRFRRPLELREQLRQVHDCGCGQLRFQRGLRIRTSSRVHPSHRVPRLDRVRDRHPDQPLKNEIIFVSEILNCIIKTLINFQMLSVCLIMYCFVVEAT